MTRDEAYAILYNLVFRGFLIGEMGLGGSLFVFKTMTEKEFNMVKACSGNPDGRGYLARFNMQFLANSVFAVDGDNVLDGRSRKMPELASFFGEVPGHLFKKIMSDLEGMRNECYDALKYLEGFCYTSESRRMWKSTRGMAPNMESVTGINGTSALGLNVHQENWMYVNRVMDDEEEYDREFSFSILIASASNPKGAKHTRSHHDSHMKNMEDHRKRLAEAGYIDTENWSEAGWAAPTDTAAELVAELDRQMKGMQDRHDKFIEEHLRKIKEKADKKAKEAEDRIKASRMVYDEPPLTVSQRPLTMEETREMITRKSPVTRTVRAEEYVEGSTSERVLRKIGSKVLTARR